MRKDQKVDKQNIVKNQNNKDEDISLNKSWNKDKILIPVLQTIQEGWRIYRPKCSD